MLAAKRSVAGLVRKAWWARALVQPTSIEKKRVVTGFAVGMEVSIFSRQRRVGVFMVAISTPEKICVPSPSRSLLWL